MKFVKVKTAKTAEVAHTYLHNGEELTQSAMLLITTKCPKVGEVKRFVLSEIASQPSGTLIDKRDPLNPLLSEQVKVEETSKRRRQEGHREYAQNVISA